VKVAMVSPYAWDRPGGVQSHIRSLSRELGNRGHRIEVFAPFSSRLEGKMHREQSGEPGVTRVGRAVGVRANGSVAPIAFGPGAAVGIRRAIASFDPSVIHLHEPLIPSLSLLALLSATVPAVGTFHAAAPSSSLYRIFKPVLDPAARRLILRTAVSEAAARLVSRYFPGDLVMTPNGVDLARFADAEPMDLGPGPNVLFLGRLEPRKGAEVLVEAMRRLTDTGASLIIAGEGALGDTLRAAAARARISAHFMGLVSEEEKVRLFRSCDIYCAPNLRGESFGIVLVEAMASGRPVVCSDLEEFRAVANDAAAYAPAGDPEALAAALRRVLMDPQLARTMGDKGLARAVVYDWRRLAPEVETIYERAAAGAGVG
jgi:phosphatidyl-myo-inositol alpha-mannosyltransferase